MPAKHVKHVRFEGIPSTPQPSHSVISPPPFKQSGSPDHYIPHIKDRIMITRPLSAAERLIRIDLTLPLENALVHPKLPNQFMDDPATEPRLPSMTIICRALPNMLIQVVESRPGHGVTIMDVLRTIHTFLRTSVLEAEFTQLLPDDQQKVSEAFQRRYRSISDEKYRAQEKSKGLKRIDRLGKDKMFAGLQSTPRGPTSWELCLSSS